MFRSLPLVLTSLIIVRTASHIESLKPVNLTVVDSLSNAVKISWKIDLSCGSVPKDVRSHTVQYRREIDGDLNAQNPLTWIDYPMPIQIVSRLSSPEIQEITTLVDEGSSISSGLFWLKLDAQISDPTMPYHKLESSKVSDPISFDASSNEFEKAIHKIDGITKVRVFRYEVGHYGSSILPSRGRYSWRIEFDVSNGPIPLFESYKETLDGEYSGGYNRVAMRRLLKGRPIEYASSLAANIGNLGAATHYEFRVGHKAMNGKELWSDVLRVKTKSFLPKLDVNKASEKQMKSKHLKRISGEGRNAGNNEDPDYIPTAATGGFDGRDGSDGLVVIIPHGKNEMIIPSRTFFYYTGKVQHYIIGNPLGSVDGNKQAALFIDIKCWGGGGSGGGSPPGSGSSEDGYSYGGGGGFIQSRIQVAPGEMLLIHVGAGGKYNGLNYDNAGAFGYDRGGKGGTSVMGPDAGSGGGYSAVLRSDGDLIAVAGGGGAGGATGYCCAHGGPGSGSSGEAGETPDTPVSIDVSMESRHRSEFTPLYCDEAECADPRDRAGLPAFHMHLDRGFAPNAAHDQKRCTGGEGGGLLLPGQPGSSSSYSVSHDNVRVGALKGGSFTGGKGSDGKEAGGGGGSGFFGGSGGGSGIDGCGGGGGSGYLDYTAVFIDSNADRSQSNLLNSPIVKRIEHDAFEISWYNSQKHAETKQDIRYYNIELSQGREGSGLEGGSCSDGYKVVDYIQAGVEFKLASRIRQLSPDTTYCVRLVAIGDRGISRKSKSAVVNTLQAPQNRWWPNHPRDNYELLRKATTSNRPSCEIPNYPAPRRGHSMSFVNDRVYLFGGLTNICICEDESAGRYGVQTVYSNEVWVLNPRTNIWKLLQEHSWNSSSIPRGREQHSATVLPNGKIIIIGGKMREDFPNEEMGKPTVFGDVWEMDPGQITAHDFLASIGNSDLNLPIDINNGHVLYHSQQVNLFTGNGHSSDQEQCVVDLSVKVSFFHPCVETLGFIALYGPGSTPSSKQPSQFAGNDSKLYIGTSNDASRCSAVNVTISFNDSSKTSFIDHNLMGFSSISIQPAEEIKSHFMGLTSDGQWTLAIYDRILDNATGILYDWELDMNVEPCEENIHWSNLSHQSNSCEVGNIAAGELQMQECPKTGDSYVQRYPERASSNNVFTPRYSHSAIAIRDNIYVLGGFAHGNVPETWRFNYSSKKWTRLHGVHSKKMKFGQTSVLSPYGVIAFGGLAETEERSFTYFYDVVTEKMSKLESKAIETAPNERYLTGMCYIGRSHIITVDAAQDEIFPERVLEPEGEPGILVFAGDQSLPNNSFLGDQWILTLQHLHSSLAPDAERRQASGCNELLDPSKTDNNPFDWTCGILADINSNNPCRWEDLIKMAWCLEQYNTFISPF